MNAKPSDFVEQHRVTTGAQATTRKQGNNGVFRFCRKGIVINCIVSDGGGWEHVSVSVSSTSKRRKFGRLPSWNEMCWVKDLFWDKSECVIQYHPPESDYVDNAPVLHLWKPLNAELPMPPKLYV